MDFGYNFEDIHGYSFRKQCPGPDAESLRDRQSVSSEKPAKLIVFFYRNFCRKLFDQNFPIEIPLFKKNLTRATAGQKFQTLGSDGVLEPIRRDKRGLG